MSEPEPFGHLLESLTTLTWVAAHTRTIGLATGILVLPQRDPLLVAKQAATLHHLSDGRLRLGVAAGWIELEYAFLRADFRDRGAIETEYIGALRALFEQARPEFHGDHVEFADALFSPRPATPLPIVVGGVGPAALRRAAAPRDGWHGLWRTPAEVRAARTVLNTAARHPFGISVARGPGPACVSPEPTPTAPCTATMPRSPRGPASSPRPVSMSSSSSLWSTPLRVSSRCSRDSPT